MTEKILDKNMAKHSKAISLHKAKVRYDQYRAFVGFQTDRMKDKGSQESSRIVCIIPVAKRIWHYENAPLCQDGSTTQREQEGFITSGTGQMYMAR